MVFVQVVDERQVHQLGRKGLQALRQGADSGLVGAQCAVGSAEEVDFAYPEHRRGSPALVLPRLDQRSLPALTLGGGHRRRVQRGIAPAAIGQHHSLQHCASLHMACDDATAADDLVVAVRCKHQHAALVVALDWLRHLVTRLQNQPGSQRIAGAGRKLAVDGADKAVEHWGSYTVSR